MNDELHDGLPVVQTATEFLVVADADVIGHAVAFEISPGNWLRSDIKAPINPLRLRLEKMSEQDRLGAEWASGEEGGSR